VGDFQAGQQLLAHVQEKDPQMYIVPFMLGEAALRQQKWDVAATQLEHCLELNPNFDQAMTALAHALVMLGNATEGRRSIENALKQNPQNYRAWYELGSIELKTDKQAALAAYQKAVAIQPNFALLRRDLGMLQFEQKSYADAAANLAKAVGLGIQEATVLNFLGISYSRSKQPQQAIESYKRALQLDPNLAEAHLNLGFAYQKLGRQRAAYEQYSEACRLKEKFCEYMSDPKRSN
jgi:tetratricopeptide (TPR) repeat protein